MACNILISLQRAVKNRNTDLHCKHGDPLVPLSVLFNFPQVWNLENRFAYKYFTQFNFRWTNQYCTKLLWHICRCILVLSARINYCFYLAPSFLYITKLNLNSTAGVVKHIQIYDLQDEWALTSLSCITLLLLAQRTLASTGLFLPVKALWEGASFPLSPVVHKGNKNPF